MTVVGEHRVCCPFAPGVRQSSEHSKLASSTAAVVAAPVGQARSHLDFTLGRGVMASAPSAVRRTSPRRTSSSVDTVPPQSSRSRSSFSRSRSSIDILITPRAPAEISASLSLPLPSSSLLLLLLLLPLPPSESIPSDSLSAKLRILLTMLTLWRERASGSSSSLESSSAISASESSSDVATAAADNEVDEILAMLASCIARPMTRCRLVSIDSRSPHSASWSCERFWSLRRRFGATLGGLGFSLSVSARSSARAFFFLFEL
mmetsp:Transcript_31878/g.63658  ORF Transcript_31878/g.63658 Transcript_31878/m.63658 type:complete len:262 (+) Transcript_31878:162-947(+)